jgi:hypothetical protein
MDEFLAEQYIPCTGHRISFNEISTGFHMWVIAKYGPHVINGMGKNTIFALIHKNTRYVAVRRSDKYYLERIIGKNMSSVNPIFPMIRPILTLVIAPSEVLAVSGVNLSIRTSDPITVVPISPLSVSTNRVSISPSDSPTINSSIDLDIPLIIPASPIPSPLFTHINPEATLKEHAQPVAIDSLPYNSHGILNVMSSTPTLPSSNSSNESIFSCTRNEGSDSYPPTINHALNFLIGRSVHLAHSDTS